MELGADGNGTRHLNGGHEGRWDYERVQHALEQHDLDQHALDQHDLDQHALDQHALDQQALDQAACIMRIYKLTIPTIFAVLVILGLLGNILVIYVILANRKLRTVTNLLLLNLAVADVSFLLVCGSFSTVHYAMTEWPLGDALCRVTQYLLYVTCYVTVYTLVAVSALRCFTVVYSATTAKYRTKVNIIVLIAMIWCLVMVFNVPTALVHTVKNYSGYTYCGMLDASVRPFYMAYFIFAYALPLIIISMLYLLILFHLLKNSTSTLSQSRHRTARASKVIVIIVVVFGCLWLPYHVQNMVANYGNLPHGMVYEVFRILWQALTYANSCANPIIYNFASQEFQNSFREVFGCCMSPMAPRTRRFNHTKGRSEYGTDTERATICENGKTTVI